MQVLYFDGKVNGYLLVDKPAGWTSHDIVAFIKKKFRLNKIGHAGTLDPDATGLLIVLVGTATKEFEKYKLFDKEYKAEITFGKTTDTDDEGGAILTEYKGQIKLDRKAMELNLQKIKCEIWQIPPAISAVKVNGVPAYRLARKGKPAVIKPRRVVIYTAELIEIREKTIDVRFVVSSGTYIRSIARELGEATGYGAVLTNLRRTKIGNWPVERAKKIEVVRPEDLVSDS